MKKLRRFDECINKLFFILFVILISNSLFAKTYYVDINNPNASDKNPGTELKPWQTIQHAANILVAGDTVFIKNGIYRESVEVKHSGLNYNKMISFIADGDSVYIKGSDIVTGWEKWKNNIWMKKNWKYNSQQVFVNGNMLQQIGGNPFYTPKRLPAVGNNENDITAGSFYYNPDEQTLFVELKDNVNPNNNIIEASDRTFLFLIRKKNFICLDGIKFMYSNTTAEIKTGWPAVNISGSN